MTPREATTEYAKFLKDGDRFRSALRRVLEGWVNSCEHYLSNTDMNRIAWLGQAAMCIDTGVPACYRGGFNLLSEAEQAAANTIALEGLNDWLELHGEERLDMQSAQSRTRMDLY